MFCFVRTWKFPCAGVCERKRKKKKGNKAEQDQWEAAKPRKRVLYSAYSVDPDSKSIYYL